MWLEIIQARYIPYYSKNQNVQVPYSFHLDLSRKKDKILLLQYHVAQTGLFLNIYTSGIVFLSRHSCQQNFSIINNS